MVWLEAPAVKICKHKETCPLFNKDKCQKHIEQGKHYNLKDFYSRAVLEHHYTKDGATFVADILLKRIGETEENPLEPMFIEVAVTHPCEEEKIASGIRIIELVVEKEDDIDAFIQHPLSSTEDTQLYNIKPTPIQGNREDFDVRLSVAHLFPSLKLHLTRHLACYCLSKRESLFGIILYEHLLSFVSNQEKGAWLYDILASKCYELYPSKFKSCHVCRHRIRNDFYGYICLCYKKAGLKRCCSDNNASTCPVFTPNLEVIKKNAGILDRYIREYPCLVTRLEELLID